MTDITIYDYNNLMDSYGYITDIKYARELLAFMDIDLSESEWTRDIYNTLRQVYVIDKKFNINDIESYMLKEEIIVKDYYTIYSDDSFNNHYIVYS